MPPKKKLTLSSFMEKYENTPADKKVDKANAKKMGVSMAKYEKSPADKKADTAGAKKMMQDKKKK